MSRRSPSPALLALQHAVTKTAATPPRFWVVKRAALGAAPRMPYADGKPAPTPPAAKAPVASTGPPAPSHMPPAASLHPTDLPPGENLPPTATQSWLSNPYVLAALAAGVGGVGLGAYGAHRMMRPRKDDEEKEASLSVKLAREKQALIGETGVGSLLGAIRAPSGHRLEGGLRGAGRGLGTGLGMAAGGAAGLLGALGAGEAMGGKPPVPLALAGLLGGLGLGGYGGYQGAGALMGAPSPEYTAAEGEAKKQKAAPRSDAKDDDSDDSDDAAKIAAAGMDGEHTALLRAMLRKRLQTKGKPRGSTRDAELTEMATTV